MDSNRAGARGPQSMNSLVKILRAGKVAALIMLASGAHANAQRRNILEAAGALGRGTHVAEVEGVAMAACWRLRASIVM